MGRLNGLFVAGSVNPARRGAMDGLHHFENGEGRLRDQTGAALADTEIVTVRFDFGIGPGAADTRHIRPNQTEGKSPPATDLFTNSG